jgi:hypothetical protein
MIDRVCRKEDLAGQTPGKHAPQSYLRKMSRCEDNGCQSHLNSFSKLCDFNATCLGSYAISHHQANKTPKKNYYIYHLM